jgi:undecaprenyl diphosphate synthase
MSEPKPLKHLGLILDGNRRWAKKHGKKVLDGHQAGAETFKTISLAAFDKGIPYVSAYVFSAENWSRTEEEVSYLMKLLLKAVEKYLSEFNDREVKIVVLGNKEGLSSDVLQALERTEKKTKDNTKGTLALCFNYGGQQEIVDAANKAIQAQKAPLTPDIIEQYLYSPDLPNVDLVIRTSGEQRTSGFMLWRAAYAELLFEDKLWPDFTVDDLNEAITAYTKRQRRFGE